MRQEIHTGKNLNFNRLRLEGKLDEKIEERLFVWPQLSFNSRRIHRARLLDSAQVTDSYLLALAATHGGQLTTFDRHLVTDAVAKGSQSLHLIA
jgi:predicted nucleic acid-binding protein